MNTPRPCFALLLLAASLTVTGCQKQTAAAVRRGIDLPVPVVNSAKAGVQAVAKTGNASRYAL